MHDKSVRRIVGRTPHGDTVSNNHANLKTLHVPGEFRGDLRAVFQGHHVTASTRYIRNSAIKAYKILSGHYQLRRLPPKPPPPPPPRSPRPPPPPPPRPPP